MAKKGEVILKVEAEVEGAVSQILRYIDRVRDLRGVQEELTEQLMNGVITQQEYNSQMSHTEEQIQSNKAKIEELNQLNEKRLHNIELQKGAISTYKDELKKLKAEYDNLSEAERNGSNGEELRTKITNLNKELDVAQSSFKRTENSIQNYENQILGAIGMNNGFVGSLMQMAQAGGGFKTMFSSMITSAGTFGKALLSLAANPIVLTLMAIVLAVKLIVEAFKKNEEATMMLDAAMDGLKNIFNILLEAMKPITDFIADVLMEVIDGAMKAVEAMISSLAGVLSFLGFDGAADKLNKFNDKVKDSVKNSLELAKAQKELKKAEDELARSQKSLQREMDKLKEIQDDSTLSDKERIKAAEELGRKKIESLKAELIVAEKALEVANIKLRTEGHTAEALALQADVSDKIAGIKDQIIKSEKDTQKSISSIRSEGAARAKEVAEKELEIKRALEDANLKMMEDGADKMRKETEIQFGREIDALNKKLNEEKGLTVAAKEALNAHIKLLEKNRAATLEKLTEEQINKDAKSKEENLKKELSFLDANSARALQIKKDLLAKEREATLKEAKDLNIDTSSISAKFRKQEEELEKDHQKAIYNDLVNSQKQKYETEMNSILGQGLVQQQMRLKIKQNELDALAKLDGESNEQYLERKKKVEEEASKIEGQYTKARLEELQATGKTENEAKLILSQEKLLQKQIELSEITKLEEESDLEFKLRKYQLEQEILRIEQETIENQYGVYSDKVKAFGQMFDDMGSILEQFGANSAALGVFSKAMALSEIGINTAKAIAQGIASAQSVPFPGNIAAVITTIGSIMANVATAKKLLSKEKTPEAPKFAAGGLVTGEGSGTSDSITARLSSGESVITAMGTQMFGPMLSAFNQIGGGVPIASANSGQQAIGQEMLTEAFRKALDSMPTPVVSVSEINDVNRRVEVLESYGSL